MPVSKPLRVLIVELGWPVSTLLAAALDDEGMYTDIVEGHALAMSRKQAFRPDVVVIGIGTVAAGSRNDPAADPIELVERFAAEADCGVMIVSGRATEGAQVASLDAGADDYVTEPVALRELASRIRAVHRRMTRAQASWKNVRVRVDVSRRGLIGPGSVTSTLTEAEFALLQALLSADGGAVSREWLGRVALKRALHEDDRSVDQLVLKLRRKLAQHGLAERAILSTRGLGYSVPEPGLFEMPRALLPPLPADLPMPPLDASEHFHRSAGGLQP